MATTYSASSSLVTPTSGHITRSGLDTRTFRVAPSGPGTSRTVAALMPATLGPRPRICVKYAIPQQNSDISGSSLLRVTHRSALQEHSHVRRPRPAPLLLAGPRRLGRPRGDRPDAHRPARGLLRPRRRGQGDLRPACGASRHPAGHRHATLTGPGRSAHGIPPPTRGTFRLAAGLT